MSYLNAALSANAPEFQQPSKVEAPPLPPAVPKMNYSDPLAAACPYYLQKAMNLKPATCEHMWYLLQTFYRNDPSKFVVISTPHQNHEKDLFHMSVEYADLYYTIRLHINGYYKRDFMITSVEYTMNTNKQWSDPAVCATFTWN